jgi:predicted nucleic acid-binding protein
VLIVDAGPLYAAAARRDRNHDACVELLATAPRPLIVPVLVVTEVAYLLADRIGPKAELAFATSIELGELAIGQLTAPDWLRITSLCSEYADMELGVVDASVIALAERLQITTVATLDRRHFAAVRPRHVDALTLVPNT